MHDLPQLNIQSTNANYENRSFDSLYFLLKLPKNCSRIFLSITLTLSFNNNLGHVQQERQRWINDPVELKTTFEICILNWWCAPLTLIKSWKLTVMSPELVRTILSWVLIKNIWSNFLFLTFHKYHLQLYPETKSFSDSFSKNWPTQQKPTVTETAKNPARNITRKRVFDPSF